jgi:PilZ domain
MSNTPQSTVPPKRAPAKAERRGSRRCKMKQWMRIRPSDPERDNFDDLRGTQSVSRTGVYFQTSESGYEIGMRVFVTLPYVHGSLSPNREYLAEVVRKDSMSNGLTGIGLKLLLELGPPHSYSFDGPAPSSR